MAAPLLLRRSANAFVASVQVLPAVRGVIRPQAKLVVLIKPQFEALRGEVRRERAAGSFSTELLLGPAQVGSGGVVRDPAVHASVLKRVVSGIEAMGFACQGTAPSPLRGAKEGNLEFLAAFVRALVMDIAACLHLLTCVRSPFCICRTL